MRAVGLVSVGLGVVAACGPVVLPPEGSTGASGSSSTAMEDTRGPASTGPVVGTGGVTTVPPGSEVEVDSGPRLDLPADAGDPECIVWAMGDCSMPSERGVVTGTTPLGEFATTRAVFGGAAGCFGWCGGGANVKTIVLFADASLVEELGSGFVDETLQLDLHADTFEGFEGPVGEPVGALLQAHRGGVTEQLYDVEVVIDLLPTDEEVIEPFVPRAAVVVTGSFAAEAPGWSVAGTFAASYCPDLNSGAICE